MIRRRRFHANAPSRGSLRQLWAIRKPLMAKNIATPSAPRLILPTATVVPPDANRNACPTNTRPAATSLSSSKLLRLSALTYGVSAGMDKNPRRGGGDEYD